MTDPVASLLTLALIGAGSVLVVLGPGFLRYWRLRRENEELEQRAEELRRGNEERARGLLEKWEPRGRGT